MDKSILLALTDAEESPRAIERAVGLAREGGVPIVIAYVHDPEVSESFERAAMTKGFLGEAVGEKIHQALDEEERLRAQETLAAVSELVRESGVEFKTTETTGRLAEVVLRLATEHGAQSVVLARRRRSALTRLVFGSPDKELSRTRGLSVEVIDEV